MVGWRGMVGSVLMQRMREERDFDHIDPVFFTTSQAGSQGPDIGRNVPPLKHAADLKELKSMEVIVSCQGGDYTNEVFPKLRADGWKGYWIDAASTLRMREDAVIILDPVNLDVIRKALAQGVRNYIGGNCTVSLMLMGMHGLLKAGVVEWMTAMTYQAASGAGAQNMRELVSQMGYIHGAAKSLLEDPASSILEIDRKVSEALRSRGLPSEHFGLPLAGSLIPWIDKDLGNGQSREEWKAQAEGNKILGRESNPVPIDGVCVRIGAMRCHSQALTIKLTKNLPLEEIEGMLASANPVGEGGAQSARGLDPGVDAGGGHRHALGADRAIAQTADGRRVPGGIYRGRPVAVGRSGAAASHAANCARTVTMCPGWTTRDTSKLIDKVSGYRRMQEES